MTRNPNMREAILSAAELLFSTRGFNAVSIRDIALEAGANPGSITYHFKTKDGLLLEIYKRHCGPMNKRRIELLVAARRVRDVQDRLEAIVRAYVQPAFSSSSDLAGGGARFTRLRAVMSAEGNAVVGRIIAEIFDDTTSAFIDAIGESLPQLPRTTIVWRSQFLLGALYYTLVNPDRVTRLSRGEADGGDMAEAIEQIVSATVASMQARDVDHVERGLETASSRAKSAHPFAMAVARKRNENSAFRELERCKHRQQTSCTRPPFPDPIPIRERRNSGSRHWRVTRTPTSLVPATNIPTHGSALYAARCTAGGFRALHKKLGIGRAVIVNASVHGTDNRVALDAIAVSDGTFRAVANIDDGITERALRELHDGGFRGCRFNFVRHLGGVPDMAVFHRIVAMVAPLGWHIDLHFDAIDLPEYAGMLAKASGPLHHRSHGARQGRRRPRPASVPHADRTDDARRKMLGQGVRLRARVFQRAAIP